MFNVLVTGGSGMVGSTLKQYLNYNESIDNFYFISSSDYDLTDMNQVERCFNERKYDKIIHLAAIVGGLYKNMNQNSQMLMKNLKINTNIIEACHKYNINRGIFCLSSCIYPKNPSKFPMTEEQLCESEPHESNEGYAYSKRMLYMLCNHYNKDYGREYICVSPVNLYGSFDNFNIRDGHVIPGLINRMFKTKNQIAPYNNEYFNVYGSGNAQRQFLYVPNFCSIILQILYNKNINNGIYNICNDEEYTIKQIVSLIAKIMNFDESKIVYDTNYSDGIIKKTVSNEKLKEIIQNIKFTDIEKGLRLTYEWFIQNVHNIRE
jgi:GDP-L-fucose synthase